MTPEERAEREQRAAAKTQTYREASSECEARMRAAIARDKAAGYVHRCPACRRGFSREEFDALPIDREDERWVHRRCPCNPPMFREMAMPKAAEGGAS